MDKRDFKNLLSEGFGKQDKKFRSLLKDSFERYDKKSKKFLKEVIERNNKFLIRKIKRDVREEFSRFVDISDISIIPQFDDIRKEMNDASHCRDQMLRTLVEHEDRFDHLGQRQDKILKTLEKHGEILGKHGDQLERIEAKLE